MCIRLYQFCSGRASSFPAILYQIHNWLAPAWDSEGAFSNNSYQASVSESFTLGKKGVTYSFSFNISSRCPQLDLVKTCFVFVTERRGEVCVVWVAYSFFQVGFNRMYSLIVVSVKLLEYYAVSYISSIPNSVALHGNVFQLGISQSRLNFDIGRVFFDNHSFQRLPPWLIPHTNNLRPYSWFVEHCSRPYSLISRCNPFARLLRYSIKEIARRQNIVRITQINSIVYRNICFI